MQNVTEYTTNRQLKSLVGSLGFSKNIIFLPRLHSYWMGTFLSSPINGLSKMFLKSYNIIKKCLFLGIKLYVTP